MVDVDMTDMPDVDMTDLPDVDLTDLPDLDLTDMPDVGVSSAGHSPNKLGIDMRGDTTYPTSSEAKSHDFLDSSSDFSLTSVSTLDVRDFEGHSPPDLEAEPENDEFFLPQTSANDGTALGGQHNLEFSKYQPDTWPSDTELSDDVGERYLSESKSRPHALYMLDMSAASIAEKIAMQRHLIVSSSGNYTEFASPCRERGASSRRKSSCLPLKKLHRFGQETCLFFRRRLLQRRETTLQKCELTLTSVPEEMDNLVLLFTKHTDFMVTEAVSIYFPSFFENKVMVPQCLLPSNSQETVDIVVCCLTHVTQGHLQGFSKICASAKCCLQTASS
ncbi:uncharacterized protein LOC112566580 isoform X2 [Pomacea canaliculata]|uniref:uncharacterized protein LOC112566580 isoform X2 n=1 Tax=Pomacea canaliculata TaxID=400727 RepID=UPI000D7259BE|nr:uncharacterized protein LOC112566580 isoform X2 [Pomacea canaliculata]